MKKLVNEIRKRFADLHEDKQPMYYYKVYVDATDEEREIAKERWSAVRGVNDAFRTLALYPSEEEAFAAMLRRVREMREVALATGCEAVGDVVEEREEFHEWWAYADLVRDSRPIRVWAQLHAVMPG